MIPGTKLEKSTLSNQCFYVFSCFKIKFVFKMIRLLGWIEQNLRTLHLESWARKLRFSCASVRGIWHHAKCYK